MLRLVLLLLLALSPWPLPAGASPAAAVAERVDGIRGAGAEHGRVGLRSAGGLEPLGRLQAPGHGCPGGCSHRFGGGPAPCPAGLRAPLALLPLAGRAGAGRNDAAVPPVCERLPYFATAPPSRR